MAVSKTISPRLRQAKLGPWPGGIDEKADIIPAGKCADAQNLLLDETPGKAIKRNGSRQLSLLPSGLPARDTYVFNKADGTSYLMASDGATLYYTTDPSIQSLWTSLKTGLTSSAFMEFETAEDRVWMTNLSDAVMSWDGTTLVLHDREFEASTDSAAVSSTTVQHTGLTGATDYWKNQKLSFTSGANQGTAVTVTGYDSATNTITFSPSLSGVLVGDRFKVGVDIPQFRAFRFWDGHMWGFSTTDNPSEGRFHRLTDPNTGADITIDNPHAWPTTFQLSFAEEDGDRVWGVSPVLRDRICVMKATGLLPIVRDPLTTYSFEVMTKAVGSRFPRSWAEKDGLLFFMGQTRDGLPDVFVTDMVSARPVDDKGGLEPTLRQLRQPNAVQRSRGFSVAADWDTGTVGSGMKTSGGNLEPKKLSTRALITALLQARSNTSYGSVPGAIDILGIPAWGVRYEGDVLPTAAAEPWIDGGTTGFSDVVSAGTLQVTRVVGVGTTYYTRRRNTVLDSTKDAYLHVRASGAVPDFAFGLFNGSKGIGISCNGLSAGGNGVYYYNGTSGGNVIITSAVDVSSVHDYHLLLRSNGTWKLWIDGALAGSGSAYDTAFNKVEFCCGQYVSNPYTTATAAASGASQSVDFERVYYSADIQDASIIPDTLPTSGTMVLQYDHGATPAALLRIYGVIALNGGALTLESWTADVSDFSSGTDPAGYVSFSNGDVPTSLSKRHQRIRLTLTRADLANSPTLTDLINLGLWRSPSVSLGSNIAAFRSFLMSLTAAAGTDATVRIRRATTTDAPSDSDFGAWSAIVSGDSIGTILSDSTPPTSRWVEVEAALGPSSGGLIPVIESFSIEWSDGSDANLPLAAIVHKKRWMACAANDGSAYNDLIVVVDRNNAWMKYAGWNVGAMVHYRGNLIGFSSADDKVFQLDYPHFKDVSAAINAYLVTRDDDAGDESVRKDLRYSDVHPGDVEADLVVSYKRPSDADFTGAKTLSCEGRGLSKRVTFPAGTVTRRVARKYANAVVDEGFELRGETVYFVARAS